MQYLEQLQAHALALHALVHVEVQHAHRLHLVVHGLVVNEKLLAPRLQAAQDFHAAHAATGSLECYIGSLQEHQRKRTLGSPAPACRPGRARGWWLSGEHSR